MNEHSNPIEFLIDFAWANGADRFIVNNAKDELNKLRLEIDNLKSKNKEWVEQTNNYLDISEEMQQLKESLSNPVAWARTNDRGDLYDLRKQSNPYVDQSTVVPLYRID